MVQREWRESSDLGNSTAGLVLVLGCAAVLRFWALGHGLPLAVGVDEPQIMNRVVQMMKTGDFNPHFFDYPALYIYVQLIVACVRFIVGTMDGLWSSLDSVGAEHFYLWGRAITASIGVATVWLLYRIGTRWGTRPALLAAGLMAVMPQHVRESHYVLTDTPLTFLTTLTLLLSLRAHERATTGAFAWAGLAAGLAAATKYNGAVALLMPLIAAGMTPDIRPSRTSAAVTAVGSCLAAFLLAAPYTWLDLPAFLNAFAYLAAHFRPRLPTEDPGWRIYLVHLRLALWWPGLVLMFVGLALALDRTVRGPGRVRWLLLVVFPAVFFYMISTRHQIFGRYLLPIMPSVCLLIAAAVISGVSLLRRFETPRAVRTALIAALTVAAVVPPAISAVRFDRMIGRPSTQSLAYAWIMENVRAGARLTVEARAVELPRDRYRVRHVDRLTEHEWEAYIKAQYEYLVASSEAFGPVLASPQKAPDQYAAYRRLFDLSKEVIRFGHSPRNYGPELRILKLEVPPDSRQ